MNDIIASIIIPAYNAEQFICRAIESALNQTLIDTEVIVINDGSTDNTEQKCMSYYENARFVYRRQENGGPASARNNGLRIAKGKYIFFLDADDCLYPEMVEKMVYAAEKENAEIVVCDIEITDFNGKIRYYSDLQEGGIYRDKELIEKIVFEFLAKLDNNGQIRNQDWAVLRRMFKRDFLCQKGIEFNENLRNSEDCLFSYTATLNATCICYLKNSYYYRNLRNKQSMSHGCNFDYWNQRLVLISEIKKLNDLHHVYLPKETWELFIFRCALAGYDNISRGLSENNKIYCLRRIKEITDNVCVKEACKKLESVKFNDYSEKLYEMCTEHKNLNILIYYMDIKQKNRLCHLIRKIGRKTGFFY